MDVERQRIQDDLRGALAGDVLCDDVTSTLYASDASIYQLQPLGVIRPRHAQDVAACVRYATENHLTLHPRGAGSGVAGESLGRGLIIDFSRYMRRWQWVEPQRTARVQPGLVLASLNRELRQERRMFGPDPATRSVTTMGSVIAVDASGSHFLRYGSARDVVRSLQVVTSAGEIVECNRHEPGEPGTPGLLAAGVKQVLSRHDGALRQLKQSGRKLRGGYRIEDCYDGTHVDLTKLLSGSEGSLALITEATVETTAVPGHRGVAMLFFHRLEAAAQGAILAVRQGVVACDLMDRRLLEIARETEPRYEPLLPREAEAMLLVELQGDSMHDLRDRLQLLVNELRDQQRLAFSATTTVQPSQRDLYWRLCRRVIPRVFRLKGNQRAVPFVEDLMVPLERLPEALTEIQAALQAESTTALVFAHAGHGQLHIRPFLDLANPEDRRRVHAISERISEVVWKHGGSISGEHASGLSRSWLLPRQYGDAWPAMPEIKRLFDPTNRLNPGKITGLGIQTSEKQFRRVEATIELREPDMAKVEVAAEVQPTSDVDADPKPSLRVLQSWDLEGGIDRAVRQCNGCGRCRTTAPEQRQCPVFRALPTEEASPRAKANLLRGVLTGDLDLQTLTSARAKEVTDLCFNCQQCRIECPASVDIPKLVTELKAQHVATNGLPLSDLLLARLDALAPLMARLPWFTNQLLSNRLSRWLMDRLFGLSAARRIPPVASRTFLRYAQRRKLTAASRGGGRKVVVFADYFINHHDPDLGKAFVEVLLHNRIGVYVHPQQTYSGMSHLSAGDLRTAKRLAERNIRAMAEAIRQGYDVVTPEPSAALCLKREYQNLMDDEDARLVAKHSHEACRYLWDLHQKHELTLDFDPVHAVVAYHQPCHVRAIDSGQPGPLLMDLIPGLTVRTIDAGCSGMAGTWGLQKKNYRNSLRIGWPMLSAMRKAPVQVATSECSACRIQIENGSKRAAIHPLKLLAYAYGRMPGVGELLLSEL